MDMKLVCVKELSSNFILDNNYVSSCRNDDGLYSIRDENGELWYFSKYKLFEYFTFA